MADIRRKIPAARQFSVATDRGFTRTYEDQSGLPVDGSNDLLRSYSPFVIRLVPPAILGNSVASGGVYDPYSRDTLSISADEREVELPPRNQTYGLLPSYALGPDGELIQTEIESFTPLEFIEEYTFVSSNPGQWLTYRHLSEHTHKDEHRGLDIYLPAGSPTYAPFNAIFLSEGETSRTGADWGRAVSLQSVDNPNLIVKIMHLRDTVAFTSGQFIPEGTRIGISYTSDREDNQLPAGSSSHLHVETIVDGNPQSQGQVNGFGYFDASRLASPGGTGFGRGMGGQPGETVTVRVETDSTQESRVGVYAAAAQSLSSLDTLTTFEESLRQGVLGSVLPAQVQRLQEIVNGEGERVVPGQSTDLTPAIQNSRVVADILLQIVEMLNVPPLQLLINPQQLQMQFTKLAQFQDRSREGYIYQVWGEELPVMSVQGKIGGFVSASGVRQGLAAPSSASGYQHSSKHDAASWQQFMALLGMYRNNGYVFDRIFGSKALHMIGSIAIDYDQWTYVGNFNSFEYSFSDEQPNGNLDFSFEFKVSRVFDNTTSNSVVSPYTNPNDLSQSDPIVGTESGTVTSSPVRGFFRNLTNTFLPPNAQIQPPTRSSVAEPGSNAWVRQQPSVEGKEVQVDGVSSFGSDTFGV